MAINKIAASDSRMKVPAEDVLERVKPDSYRVRVSKKILGNYKQMQLISYTLGPYVKSINYNLCKISSVSCESLLANPPKHDRQRSFTLRNEDTGNAIGVLLLGAVTRKSTLGPAFLMLLHGTGTS